MVGLVVAALAVTADDAEARCTGHPRTQAIDMVVIHSTGGPTCDAITGKPIWVKAGTLTENMRKIEADPRLGVHYSGQSIGIELINNGDGRDPFPEAQLATLVKLLRDITQRRGITRAGIKRHSDLDHAQLSCDRTQRRKVDPGAAFPYESILNRVFQPQ